MDIDKLIDLALDSLFNSVGASIKDISREEFKMHLNKYTQSKKQQIDQLPPIELPEIIAQQMIKSVIFQIDAHLAMNRLAKMEYLAKGVH